SDKLIHAGSKTRQCGGTLDPFTSALSVFQINTSGDPSQAYLTITRIEVGRYWTFPQDLDAT
ncbi:MAG TPA: hypothetical protein PLO50_00770, partial [Nitrospira sp.]|nr:hypothetical protein [Nitrospira sp.]